MISYLLCWQAHYMLGLALVNNQKLAEGIKAQEKAGNALLGGTTQNKCANKQLQASILCCFPVENNPLK